MGAAFPSVTVVEIMAIDARNRGGGSGIAPSACDGSSFVMLSGSISQQHPPLHHTTGLYHGRHHTS